MSAWIDPKLLQLIALGTAGDPYLADGRHLRWFVAPTLGFPRTGFLLRRRPALVWDPEVLDAEGILRHQELTEGALAAGQWESRRVRFDNGLEVSRQSWPPSFATVAGFQALELGDLPYALDIGPPVPAPISGAGRRDPAAYLALTVLLEAQDSAFAEARASFDAHGDGGLVDRGRVTAADGGPPSGEWVEARILLDGGLIEHVEVWGEGAYLLRAQWVPSRLYGDSPGWDEVERFRLPLTTAAPTYPAWTAEPGAQVAAGRLRSSMPRAFPPWEQAAHPPPAADPAQMEADLERRYLGEAFSAVDAALHTFLDGELRAVVPQSEVSEPESMTSMDHPDLPARLLHYPQRMLLSAATDPQTARLLGLMTTDGWDLANPYDYLLEAEFPGIWLRYAQSPALAETALGPLREQWQETPDFDDQGRPQGVWAAVFAGQRVLSLATGVAARAVPLPLPPAGLTARVQAAPGHRPVPALARLHWEAPAASLFEDRSQPVFYALRRRSSGEEVVLNRRDEELGVPLPIVPTRAAEADGRIPYLDRQLPDWGTYTYRLSGMDLWGRFSAWAEVSVAAADELPPPAPKVLQAQLLGDDGEAPSWTGVRITFEWPSYLAEEGEDLDRLRVHLRQGRLPPAQGEDTGSWGRFEHRPGAGDPPIEVPWPPVPGALAGAGLEATLEVETLAAEAGGGHRLTVVAGPIEHAFVDGFAHLSATVTAVDTAGNESPPAVHALARRADGRAPAPTSLPAELQWGSTPDARMRSFYSLPVQAPAGGTLEVRRAAEATLLRAAGADPETWRAREEEERIRLLREMALAHPDAFVPDAEVPLDDAARSHTVELAGGDRGWTVLVALPYSRTGVRAPWPQDVHSFAVVAVPRRRPLAPPHLEEVRSVDGAVELRVGADPEGVASRLCLYRSRRPGRTDDVRRMRPVASVPMAVVGAAAAPVEVLDDSVHPYREYFYRVVVESDDGRRSPASAPVVARTWTSAPPPAAEILSVTLAPLPPERQVRFRLERADYEAELLRRAVGSAIWQVAAGGALDLEALAVPGTDGEYLVVDPIPGDPAQGPFAYVVRVRDPSGRTSHSPAYVESFEKGEGPPDPGGKGRDSPSRDDSTKKESP